MKRKFIFIILLCLLISNLFGKDFDVLYINSYHPGYTWSDNIENSFRKVLNDSGLSIHLFQEYMDTKRLDNAVYNDEYARWLRSRYRNISFSVIVTADNSAFNFMKQYRDTLFPEVPLVFCGINDFDPSQIEGMVKTTGVAENGSFAETLKLIARLQPDIDTVIAVTDRTDTGQIDLTRLRRDLMLVVPAMKLVVMEGDTPDEMKSEFAKYDPKKTAIIHISYFRDKEGNHYEMENSIRILLDSTRIPVYSKSEVKIGSGLMGGVVSSAELQGRIAAVMVLRFLEGTPVQAISVVPVSPMKTIVDYRVLHASRIPASRIPPGTKIIHQEETTSQRTAFIIGLSIFALTFLLFGVLYFSRKSRNLSLTLKSANTHFDQLLSELDDGVFYTRIDGTIEMVNMALAEILGEQSPETIIGKNIIDYIPTELREMTLHSYKKAIANEETEDREFCISKTDGSRRWILIKPIFIRKNGIVTGVKGIINDITLRKKAEYHLTLQKNLGIKLNQAILPDELFKASADFLHSLEGVISTALYEKTPDSSLVLISSRGIPTSALQMIHEFKKDSMEAGIVLKGKVCYLNLMDTEDKDLQKIPNADKIRNLAVIPLISGDRIIGALNVSAEEMSFFTPEIKALIERAASQITDAYLRIRRESEIRYNRTFLDSIIENLPLGLQIFDSEGNTLRLNKSRAAFLGLTDENPKREHHPVKDDPFYSEVFRTGRTISRELPMILPEEPYSDKPEDRTFFLKEYLFPIRSEEGDISAVISLTQDITRSKHYEGLLEKAREEAELGSRAKSEFLANMSHEIRTPLNAIIGYSELLADLLEERKEAEFAEGILTSGRSLMTILNDILDLSKMEAGMMELHESPVSLSGMMREIEQIFALKAEEKNLRFRTGVDPVLPESLLLDEIRLRQVLINLVGNAIKFTKSGIVTITVRGEPSNTENTVNVVFDIMDTGIGIPENDQHRIFEAFRQTHRQNMVEYGGTGLGLTISRRLVSFMGGEILLKSEPGKGSIFSVRLEEVPVGSPSDNIEEKTAERSWKKIRFAGGRVLIVDDVESNRTIIRESLIKAGIEVREAENGLQAEKMLVDWYPDCVLMDIRMPVRDGYETTRIFRADNRWSDLFIVALSASTSGNPVNSGLFQRFLLKPVKMNDLFKLLTERIPLREPE